RRRLEVELQCGGQRDRAQGRADHLRIGGALLVGHLAGNQGARGRREDLNRIAEDLRGPAADHHVLRRDGEAVGDRALEHGDLVEAVAAGAPARAERGANGVEHGRARAERVLVVVQEQGPRRRCGARHRGPGLTPRGENAGAAEAGCLHECAARARHEGLLARPARAHGWPPETGEASAAPERWAPITSPKTRLACCISSIVPTETRAWTLSSGGNSRPTRTPRFAQASLNSAAGQPVSTKTKLVCESITRQPRWPNTPEVNARACALRSRSASMCAASSRDAIAAATASVFVLYFMAQRLKLSIVRGWAIA